MVLIFREILPTSAVWNKAKQSEGYAYWYQDITEVMIT